MKAKANSVDRFRQLLILPFCAGLVACEPPSARETPVTLTPGRYVLELPLFVPRSALADDRPCIKDGAEERLPIVLINLPFEALKECNVREPLRKGNYLTVTGTCKPADGFGNGQTLIEGWETISPTELNGSFKMDMSGVDLTTADAKKAALLTKFTRFTFKAKRIGDC